MKFTKVYFLGIGGIGMSALARYCLHEGLQVAGYDRTPSELTEALSREGAHITYEDTPDTIPAKFKNPADTQVVYTPAIPSDSPQLLFFRNGNFEIEKRSRMLGVVSRNKFLMAVSGTHGKTTTSTMTAWFNHEAADGGSAFLGGISKNFDSNLVLGKGNRLVAEADEFDRSFLQLYPDVAVVTAADADHLDIYGTHEAVKEAFAAFIDQIKPGGTLILKKGVDVAVRNTAIKVYRYSYDSPCDFYAERIRVGANGCYTFDIVCLDRTLADCTLGIPGWVNVENSVAAAAICLTYGVNPETIRHAIGTFQGVKRRLDIHLNTEKISYIDDYAHHPKELATAISSMRDIFPGRKLTAIFQPHLYTRTRDFAEGFAEALSKVDKLILLDIYPAREEPIPGVTSEIIYDKVTAPEKVLLKKEELMGYLEKEPVDVLVTFGAGNIDRFIEPIEDMLKKRVGE